MKSYRYQCSHFLCAILWKVISRHPAQSGQTVRLPVWPWQQVCVWGLYESWQQVCVRPVWNGGDAGIMKIFMTSQVYWLWYGGHTQVRLSGLQELGREEGGGSELIAHIYVISRSLPVADTWIDIDVSRICTVFRLFHYFKLFFHSMDLKCRRFVRIGHTCLLLLLPSTFW